MLDLSDLGPFDPNSPFDSACERERSAIGLYIAKRFGKLGRRREAISDQEAMHSVIVGGITAVCTAVVGMNHGEPPEKALQGLHDLLDFAWIQATGIVPAAGPEDTVQ